MKKGDGRFQLEEVGSTWQQAGSRSVRRTLVALIHDALCRQWPDERLLWELGWRIKPLQQ